MEALERRGKVLAIAAIVFIVFWSQCKGVEGVRNSTKMSYVCPPEFIRLGHSCYFFSETQATWQSALFACKDRDSSLSVPARWEDRNLRKHLNKPTVDKSSRWIGGIYDYGQRSWRWGGELRSMHYQSFSKMQKMAPEELQFHCIAMMPDLLYRWAPKSCVEPRKYICQTKLRKVPKSKLKDYKRRWQRMGKINEITAPTMSREINDPKYNDVTANPIVNPKSYDLRPSPIRMRPKQRPHPRNHMRPGQMRPGHMRPGHARPNDLKKRSRPQGRLIRPFPGYHWNRRDPETSYLKNVQILKNGKTGLSPQQVNAHLARLAHLRDRQLAKLKRVHMRNEPNTVPVLSHTRVKTYTVDNNISALHPKTIVEEFDMMPPPPPVNMPVVRPVRRAPFG